MKILIVRMFPSVVKVNNYNMQEIGLAKALIRKGNTCDIVYYNADMKNRKEEIKFKDGVITICWIKGKSFIKNCFYDKELFDLVKEYDVVQTSEFDQMQNVKLMKKCKNLVIYHGPYYSDYKKRFNFKCKMEKIFYFNFHRNYFKLKYLAKSNLAKKYLESVGCIDVTEVGVGLDIEKFEGKISNFEKEKTDCFELLYIGDIVDGKNVLFTIDVLKELSIHHNVKLTLIGKSNSEYAKMCFSHAKEIGIDDKIEYIESVPQTEIYKYYNKADLFVLPTKYEIFGMVILEAMYFGVPIITTLNGGSSTIINKDVGIIEDLDVSKWSREITKIITGKKTFNRKKIHDKIIKEHTWDVLADKFLQVYAKGR